MTRWSQLERIFSGMKGSEIDGGYLAEGFVIRDLYISAVNPQK